MARIDNIINGNSSYSRDVSDNTLVKASLAIWIYRGAQGNSVAEGVTLGASNDRPAEPTYELTSSAIAYNDTKIASFDISTLLKDYLDPSTADMYTGNVSVWVDIQITTTDANGETIGASEHYLGEDGYYYATEDQTPALISSRISNFDIHKLQNELYRLPIRTSLNPTVKFFANGDGGPTEIILPSSEQSSEQVEYQNIITGSSVVVIEDGVYGDDVLLNGSLVDSSDWTLNGSDSMQNGQWVLNGAGGRNPTGYEPLLGEVFTVTFTVSQYTSGILNGVYDGSGGVNMSGPISAVGTYSFTYIQTETSDNKLSFFSAASVSMTIRDISWIKHENVLPSINIADNNGWFKGPTVPTVNTGITDPTGGSDAYSISTSSSGYVSSTAIPKIEELEEITISVYLKGTTSVIIKLQELFGDYTNYFTKTVTAGSTWVRHEITGIKPVDGNPSRMVISKVGSGTIEMYHPQVTRKQPDTIINVIDVCEPKYDPVKLTFVNKMGAFQDVWFFANRKESLKIDSDSWNRRSELGSETITRASRVRNITSMTQQFTLNSGFYPESSNVVFEELMQSNNVWMTKDGETVPVSITDTKFNFKDGITDKTINYTFNLEHAFNKTRSLY